MGDTLLVCALRPRRTRDGVRYLEGQLGGLRVLVAPAAVRSSESVPPWELRLARQPRRPRPTRGGSDG